MSLTLCCARRGWRRLTAALRRTVDHPGPGDVQDRAAADIDELEATTEALSGISERGLDCGEHEAHRQY